MLEMFIKVQILRWETPSSLESNAGDGNPWIKFKRSKGLSATDPGLSESEKSWSLWCALGNLSQCICPRELEPVQEG